MKLKVSKFKKHNFCNIDKSEAATRCSTKKSTLKNFAISAGKHPRPSLSAINLQALRRVTISKRDAKTDAPPSPPAFLRVLRIPQEHSF